MYRVSGISGQIVGFKGEIVSLLKKCAGPFNAGAHVTICSTAARRDLRPMERGKGIRKLSSDAGIGNNNNIMGIMVM
ncbi:hypothetical protein XENTR_v10010528 [Xenopus tropicalis]|nr:hypothetical protein XENTR_v10010528 [Xenopus tropicalis]